MFKKHKGALSWLFKNLKPILGSIILLTVTGVLISYITVEFAMASRELLDSATGVSQKGFVPCVISLAVLLVLEVILESFYNIYAIKISSKNKNRLQKNLFYSVMTRDFSSASKYHSGDIINRLTSDIGIINSNIIDLIPAFVMLVTSVIFGFVAMARLDLSLSLICLALGPVVIFTSVIYGRKMKKLHKDCLESDGKTRSFMQECIQNLLVIKAFTAEKNTARHTAKLQKLNYKLNMKRGYISIFVNLLYYLLMTVAYYFAVSWCAYKISIGIMTVGTFTAILQLVNQIQSPFREISGTVSQFFATCASAERIMEVEDMPEDKSDYENIYDFHKILLSDVDFAYEDDYVLNGLNFEVSKGDITVITGLSGKGKSTLFKLLMGIYNPLSGSATITYDLGERPIDSSVRPLFAYVPQGNMIVSGTIKENIAFFSDASDTEIEKAAEVSGILSYIKTLPDGFDTDLGEGGLGLSEGQVQRIAIARALCTKAPVLLLDEATSALDEKTELEILENIKNLHGKTVLLITHKTAALDIATKHYVLNDKKLTLQ